jgi:hypothetical protein
MTEEKYKARDIVATTLYDREMRRLEEAGVMFTLSLAGRRVGLRRMINNHVIRVSRHGIQRLSLTN